MNVTTCYGNYNCLFPSLNCFNQKCYQAYRYLGDSCEIDGQCLQDTTTYTTLNDFLANFIGVKCIQNKCSKFKIEKRNNGDSCYVDNNAKIIYGCKEGSTCYKYVTSGQPSKCVPIVRVGKGAVCGNAESDAPQFTLCGNGLQCKETSKGSGQWTCMDRIPRGGVCSTTGTDLCDNDLVCRQTSQSDPTFTCQNVPSYGDSCVIDSDCAFSKSNIVKCINYKCQRIYGTPLGGSCKQNDECYTSYCSTSKRCEEKLDDDICGNSDGCKLGACSCGGKGTLPYTFGKCTTPCDGPATDIRACLYNMGIDVTSGTRVYHGLDKNQFADQASSLFTKCKVAYSRYYSCMKKSLEKTGISSSGDLAGVDWQAYSASALPILPERSAASSLNSVIGLLVLIFVFLINLL
ncbi:predicted protein [Naegleria gruberi]|uniref:Predicted protein n=1 Tax=Naegleria gruberi TaxID=5762 RepID=D2VYU5_NAEGR|nr:uncharacterized protein NAEGRDRAFT_81746 [Naegleria gruberi]EFC38017.1 predicted protein [Naegleria gruberi]|eukprot:XP_002670761.1 predicted protein [Naegleria gruberi strain NEG-M]